MSGGTALALLGMLALAASGAHMRLQPHIYLGKGTAPATDPRTVRWFGTVLLFLGAASAAFILIKFASE